MQYSVIRGLLLLFLIILILVTHIKNSRIHNDWLRKHGIILAVFSMAALMIILSPFERQLLHFKTPEQAFHHRFAENILVSVNNRNCTFIIYGNDVSSPQLTYVATDGDGWLYPNVNPHKAIQKSGIANNAFVTYFFPSEADMAFVLVNRGAFDDDSPPIVVDSQNTVFVHQRLKYDKVDYYMDLSYGLIDANDTSYWITVDGTNVFLG